jgi:hypothetical protein
MARDDKRSARPDDEPSDEGIIHDEYTDPELDDVHELDALDVPGALVDEGILDEMADDADGIEELDVLPVSGRIMDTVDTGARMGARRAANDEADMGFGAEPRSPEELEDASIGHELRGRGAVTRDDELHGELLLDSPDGDTGESAEGGTDRR